MPSDISTGLTSAAMTRAEFGEQDSSESYFENNIERINTRVVNIRVDTQDWAGSSLIWGNPTFGIWGSYLWAGSVTTPFVRTREDYMWQDYTEEFINTNYCDVGSTTALWGTTGSVTFGPGSVLQTINLGSDIQLPTTQFNKYKVSISGSYTYLLTGSVSSSNGSSWTPIGTFNAEQTITGSLGSEMLIRLADTTGSVILTSINAYFHTSDII